MTSLTTGKARLRAAWIYALAGTAQAGPRYDAMALRDKMQLSERAETVIGIVSGAVLVVIAAGIAFHFF